MKNVHMKNTESTPRQLNEARNEVAEPASKAEPEKGIRAILAVLPRFSDANQKRAAGNIFKFLAVLVILTLVARGTAGATLARVDAGSLTRGEIVESITDSAIVNAQSHLEITAPEGLTVIDMPVGTGQSIEYGDVVAAFDTDEIQYELEKELSILEGMYLKLSLLERDERVDGSSVKSAQTNVDRAADDYNTVQMQGEANVADAQSDLDEAMRDEMQMRYNLETAPFIAEDEARRAWDEAASYERQMQDALNNALPEDEADAKEALAQASKATQDKKKALDSAYADAYADAYKEWEAANEEVEKTQTALDSAIDKSDQELLSAQRKIEDANLSLSKAQQDQSKLKQQAADTAAQNSIDAKVQQLDIEKQEELVAQLQQLMDNEGALYSDISGVVSKTVQENDVTSVAALITLADNTGVYEAALKLDKTDAEKLATGNECEVTTGGGSMYYKPTVQAVISSIGSPDEDGLVTVTVRLPEGDWTGGQSVKVQFVQSRDSYDTCIPLSALRSDSSGYYVFTVEQHSSVLGIENVIIRIPVTLQAMDESMAAVNGPLERNAIIVTNSNKAIESGDRVRVNES